MGSKDLKLEVNISDADLVKNLIYAVEKYYEDMPIELQNCIKEIDKTGCRDFTTSDLEKYVKENNLDYGRIEVIPDDLKVVSANKYLKRVLLSDGTYKDLEYFALKIDNHIILEW